jgi:NADH-quinone oxidoreductase subunit L
MGGIRKKLPVIYWTFLAGAASLAAIPFISAGFYSKDMILFYAWASDYGDKWLYAAGLLGAFLTAIYTFRMVFVTFFGEQKTKISHYPKSLINIPLIILAVLSIAGGFIQLPHNIAHFTIFSDFVDNSLQSVKVTDVAYESEFMLQVFAATAGLLGIFIAYWFWLRKPGSASAYEKSKVSYFFYKGWGFDWLYDRIFVYPIMWLSQINKKDFIDKIYNGIAFIAGILHHTFSLSQTGRLRWYAMGIVFGAVIILTVVIFI